MKVEDLSVELSIKLGDAVLGGYSDGQIFTSDTRLGYISRAYGKLNRVLKSLMRNESPEFTKSVDYFEISADGTGAGKNEYSLEPYIEIIDVYALLGNLNTNVPEELKPPKTIEGPNLNISMIKADRIAPQEFLNVLMQKNDYRTPSFENNKIYYTVVNKKLMFLPDATMNGNNRYKYKGYVMTKISDITDLKLDDEVYITNDYKDLLITFGAYEGMMDIARQDKVQLYGQEINSQLQILSQFAQLEKREEGISEQRNQ